jgi:hypothetical protein
MKIVLIILLLLPCFLKAQTASDTTYADTTTRIFIAKAGLVVFDTIRIANNSIQGFTYDLKGFSLTQQFFAHLVFYVSNVNGVYTFRRIPNDTYINYSSVAIGSVFEAVQSLNSVVVRYRSASTNVINWTLTKTKIGL